MIKDFLASLLITLFLVTSVSFVSNNKKFLSPVSDQISNSADFIKEFGIAVNKHVIEKGEITPNLFISNLFSNYNIAPTVVSKILKKSRNVFDVRKIRRGQAYSVFLSADESKKVNYIVYQKNPIDYVVFDFTDSLNVYTGKKKVKTVEKTVSGTINSNLWFALQDNGANPLLANELSEVYAWTVDFFGIQKGDNFKVIYEEKLVDEQTIGVGKIIAAVFNHYGKDIYAIPFRQDSVDSYYDIDGSSLKRAFLKAPLKYSRISSGFSNSRLHPILKIYRPHHGVDYSAPIGTPVQSIGEGTVLLAQYGKGAGYWVKIRHNSVYTTAYLHLSKFGEGVKPGARVTQGQVIGYVGSTGLSTGPHLDFRVYKNNHAINPLTMEAPPVEPIKNENIKAFKAVKDAYLKKISNIQFKPENMAK